MNWWIWHLLFWPMAIMPYSLVLDRVFGIQARRLWVFPGLPLLGVFGGALAYAAVTGDEVTRLVGWGAVMGVAGSVALDIVRLIGVRYGAFPMDMPEMFGMIALGHAPRLQRNLMREVVAVTAVLPAPEREVALEPRLHALARMPLERRAGAVSNMMAGLATLPDEQRKGMLASQMAVLSRTDSKERRAVMAAMDAALANGSNGRPMYGQARGMPKMPMVIFRGLADRAMPRTREETGAALGAVRLAGYTWHLLIGITFGIAYALMVGQGSWPLAIGWGVFVWAAMMVQMPAMMPMVRFPLWFVVVPFVAHIAMVIPFALIGLTLVTDGAHLRSVWGAMS